MHAGWCLLPMPQRHASLHLGQQGALRSQVVAASGHESPPLPPTHTGPLACAPSPPGRPTVHACMHAQCTGGSRGCRRWGTLQQVQRASRPPDALSIATPLRSL